MRAPLLPDLRTLGARPLAGHLVDQELASGNVARLVVPELARGLARLGYGVDVQAAAVRQLRGRRSLTGAPGISLASLRDKGLGEEAIGRLETALVEASNLGQALNPWVLGADACERELGLAPIASDDYGFDLAAALGYAPKAVAAANRYCFGSGTLAGTPGLAEADAIVLACPPDEAAGLDAEGRMAAALNAVLSTPVAQIMPAGTERAAPDSQPLEDSPMAPTHALAAVGRL
jgi:ribonucleoside-diphosphate reductase alpha chain